MDSHHVTSLLVWLRSQNFGNKLRCNGYEFKHKRVKMSAVCGPHLQTSAEEEVDQTSAVCKKKTVCFFNFCSLLK
ncbi:hypothetical protein QVD17_03148 [Tagetes erecta]|uniref:Uncharacterized protein n=1 Tax=Tagetes erecta TaxID=13708 RepID=A0AAD8P9Q1_TARER|nr:hypothetical protein QVD17_03148 [Tagetes erecta]